MAEDNPIESMLDLDKKDRTKKQKFNDEKRAMIVSAIDAEIGDAYSYSGSDYYKQMAEAWRRYYQQPFGNEEPNESDYVSSMLTKHVNQVRAFITDRFGGTAAPVIKFRPYSKEDIQSADAATDFVNHYFRNKLNGSTFIDKTVFNAALLKCCPVRIFIDNKPQMDETYEYEFEGTPEEFNEDYANFESNEENKNIIDTQPTKETTTLFNEAGEEIPAPQEGQEIPTPSKVKVAMKWDMKLPDNKEVNTYVISPGSFFVSNQAENLDEANMVAQIARTKIGILKRNYPDAPKMNEMKEDEFWSQLQTEYVEWFRETEWLERWAYDTLGIQEQEDGIDDNAGAGLGARELYVMDAEIYLDLEDKGDVKLYHVIKAGGYILSINEIQERSFVNGSLVDTGNKWNGLSLYDIIRHDIAAESTLSRSFIISAAKSANPHPIIDMNQVEQKDILNLQDGQIIRKKAGAIQGAGPAVEWTQHPGPSASVLQAIDMLKSSSSVTTGAGQGFQGAQTDDVSKHRIGEETAKIIDNNSSLMLNYFVRQYENFLSQVLVKIWNAAVEGGVTPEMYTSEDEWKEFDPKEHKRRVDFIINPDLGADDRQEKSAQATALLTTMSQPIPGVQWLPNAGYQGAKMLLEANEIKDVDNWLVNPETQQALAEDPQVQAFMDNAQAQIQQQVAQAVEMERQKILEMPDAMLKTAQAELAKAKAMNLDDSLEHTKDKDAFMVSQKIDDADRIDERAAVDKAIDIKRVELQEKEINEEIKLANKEFAAGKPTSNIGAG